MRSVFLLTVFLLVATLLPAQSLDPAKGKADGEQIWYDIKLLDVEGQGWKDVKAPFDRLPAKAEKMVRSAVWGLSRHSAGLCVRFRTDATTISARWTVTNKRLEMPHMPATGVSGLDLYVRGNAGKWQWLGVGFPRAETSTAVLARGLNAGEQREFLLYLPLYNGVSSVEIGLPKGSKLSKGQPYPGNRKPIVFYGTSITQGGCASRPGMVHTAILGRKLGYPVINLGFSGNGRMEMELAKLMGEIDASAYVLDCLPNINAKEVTERTEPFVKYLRKVRPHTPIILVEDRSYANSAILKGPAERNRTNRAALRAAWEKMFWEGVDSLHYIYGDKLIGDDGEGTVDSSHPTDLGFLRQAEAMEPTIRYTLNSSERGRSPIEGYTDQLSYQAGDTIQFHLSSKSPTIDMEIVRMGDKREVVWSKKGIACKDHPVPENASSHGCSWPSAFSLPVSEKWRSGYYVAQMTGTSDGKKAAGSLFFVVRSANPGKTAKMLLVLSTNTYNAYTNWGGYSLYAYNGRNRVQGRRVSFDRPITSQFFNWEYPFIQWAESNGLAVDVAVNSDVEFRPEILKGYKLVLSVGHDEYWSAPMRDNLEKYISEGGNVVFFSGNTCCWQVRSEDKGRALVCYKQAYRADPHYAKKELKTLSSLWGHHLIARPENTLTGVGFLHGGYHRSHGQYMDGSGAFTVQEPNHWIFAGTDLKAGTNFGGKDTIVGYECDGCELKKDSKGKLVPTYRDGTPKNFQVLALAPARWHPDDCEWYEKWEKGRNGHAVVGIYTRGGTVITVGSTDWAHGLRGRDPAVMKITRNILDRLGK